MIKSGGNIFKISSKSLSLSKINPYYQNKEHYLPYKYKDISFKTKYNGLLLQKDFYLFNLMKNHLKKTISYKNNNQKNLPLIESHPIEVSKKKELVFNSEDFKKKQIINEYRKYAFSKLKKEFFSFNPVTSKSDMMNYRKAKFKNIPTYRENVRYNPKMFILNFKKQINQNNFKRWEKIKQEYELKELQNGYKDDIFYDKDKIWEIINNNKKKFLNSINTEYSDTEQKNENEQIKGKSVTLSPIKKIHILKKKIK
jgi:hypothetical protein